MKSYLFEESTRYLTAGDATLIFAALLGVAGTVVSMWLGLRTPRASGAIATALGLAATMGVVASVAILAPPAFSFRGEEAFSAALSVAGKCGVGQSEYSAWLRKEVLKDGELERGSTVSLSGTNGILTAKKGPKGYRVKCGVNPSGL